MGALPENHVTRLSSCEDLKIYLSKSSLKESSVNYFFEQEVDGSSFIQLTEESLRSDFPLLNFGQRKECMKIINNILASKDKFLFSDVDVQNSTGTEVYDAATVKAMNPKELSIFLQDKCQGVSAETIVYLLNEDVDGESFLEFTDQSLLSNFPGLSCDQRMSILRVVSNAGDAQYETTFHFTNHNVIEIPLQEDLGCGVLQGFVDEGGILKAVTGETSQKVDVAPCVSGSFLKKRKQNSSVARKRPKFNPEDVEPLNVLSLLEESHEGQKVIDYVRTKKMCDLYHQKVMMRILYNNYCVDKESPLKYYPANVSKIAMAKGIVTTFPELADSIGDCPWASWLEVVKTKFETVQSNLEPHKRKNKPPAKSGLGSRKSVPHTSSSVSNSMASSNQISENDESEETLTNQIRIMGEMLPTSINKQLISLALFQTYTPRRKWILQNSPSATEIIGLYKHLKSYEGEMISEEFSRIQKLHDDAVLKFKRSVPFILEYALKAKPKIYEEVCNKFSNANVRALVLLTKLLTVTLSKNTNSLEEREHIKNFKTSIESIPSSALFQVVPEGTDVENHISEETHPVPSEQLAPIFPYLLWSTRDFRSGMIYLKIDKLCFLIERVENEDSILRAFDIFIKAHHVFMLKYHPYLRTTVFDYFESLYGIKTPLNSVARFMTALRNMN